MSEQTDVIVEIRGGCATVDQRPEGVRVVVRDYDVEGVDEDRLTVDSDGDECVEEVYEDEDKPERDCRWCSHLVFYNKEGSARCAFGRPSSNRGCDDFDDVRER